MSAAADALMGVFGMRRMIVLAVDPGPVQSGFALYDGVRVLRSGVLPNCDLLRIVSDDNSDVLASREDRQLREHRQQRHIRHLRVDRAVPAGVGLPG
jgi:hypothetical protein